jgi:hypothetical protein
MKRDAHIHHIWTKQASTNEHAMSGTFSQIQEIKNVISNRTSVIPKLKMPTVRKTGRQGPQKTQGPTKPEEIEKMQIGKYYTHNHRYAERTIGNETCAKGAKHCCLL